MIKRVSSLIAVLALGLAIASLAGCSGSVSVGDDTVPKADIEKEAQAKFDAIAEQGGQASFPHITCPDDLKAEKDATTRCSAAGEDGTLGITVTVTSVTDDGTANLHFQGDDQLTQ